MYTDKKQKEMVQMVIQETRAKKITWGHKEV